MGKAKNKWDRRRDRDGLRALGVQRVEETD